MAEVQNRAALEEAEAIICRLRGVVSARLVADDRGEISEIHVVADQTRHPKQLSRDIESVLFSEAGVRVDHRKISIAQVRGGAEAPAEVRLKFLSIDYSLDRTTARARVSVGRGDESYTGAVSVPVGPTLDQEQLIARASVAAVEEFIRANSLGDGIAGLELRELVKSENQGHPFIMVTVRVLGGRHQEELLGSALVRDDPWKAAALAALDALNRRLPALCA
jgi:hypothetical protein